GYIYIVFDAALAAETKTHLRSLYINMSILHGGEAERFVFASVLFVPHADETVLEQLHDRRQHFVSRQSGQRQIFAHTPADFRQRFPKRNNSFVFVFIAHFAPALVINVLLAISCIAPSRLDVTVSRRGNT